MFVDDGLHIIPTAVAYFHVVLVEDLMEFVILSRGGCRIFGDYSSNLLGS